MLFTELEFDRQAKQLSNNEGYERIEMTEQLTSNHETLYTNKSLLNCCDTVVNYNMQQHTVYGWKNVLQNELYIYNSLLIICKEMN